MSRSSELVSKSEYARRRGCAPSAITRALKEGRIQAVDGKIDVKAADKLWAQSTRARHDSKASQPQKPSRPMDLPAVALPGYHEHRARRELASAEREEMELSRMRGRLINAADAERAVFEGFRELRDALGRLPRRLAGLVIGLTDPREVERIVDHEMKAVLEAFARPTTQVLQRVTTR